MYKELIKKIDKAIADNELTRKLVVDDGVFSVSFGRNIDALTQAKAAIENFEKELEHEKNELWEFVKSFILLPSDGGMDVTTFAEIFGHNFPSQMVKTHTYQEALAKVREYDQKKKEEAERLVVGDVVDVFSLQNTVLIRSGLFTGEDDKTYSVLIDGTNLYHYYKCNTTIVKTGKHFDIQGMLDELRQED